MTVRRFLCDNPAHSTFEATFTWMTHKLHCPHCKRDWVAKAALEFGRRLGADWPENRLLELADATWHNAVDTAIAYGDPIANPEDEVDEELSCWTE